MKFGNFPNESLWESDVDPARWTNEGAEGFLRYSQITGK